MKIELKKFGEMLISRPAGREDFLALSAYLTKGVSRDEIIEIDFSGVKVMAPSWADEVITKLAAEFANIRFLNTENPTVKATLKTLAEYSNLTIQYQKEEADELKKKLEAAGAKVELK